MSTSLIRALPRSSLRSLSQSQRYFSSFSPSNKLNVVALLYPGEEAGRRNPNVLGCVENALGLPQWLKSQPFGSSVNLHVTSSISEAEKLLPSAHVAISQPFYPLYLTRARIASAKNLQLSITAGIGSDHVDLQAAMERGMTVSEVTGSNVVSVAEQVVMTILMLVRGWQEGHRQVGAGEWDVAKVADKAWDLEGKSVGTLGSGRIGLRVLQRLKPFDVKLHYTDAFRLPVEVEKQLNVQWHDSVESLVKAVDVLTINCPLHPQTEGLVGKKLISLMKPGAFIVNTARGKIVDRDAIKEAVDSGRLGGYGGDVWFPQPAPADHPWRQLGTKGAMTIHYSGTTLDAQRRYAEGTREMLAQFLSGQPFRKEYLIVDKGKLATTAYTEGDATKGSEAAATRK